MIADPIAYRRQRALELGIDAAFDPQQGPLLEQISAVNAGRRADIVIVTPSNVAAMQQGIDLVGPGGTVLLFAPPPPDEILPIFPHHHFFQEITLCTSYSAGPYETTQALELLQTGRIRAEAIITHRFALQDVAQAFRLVAHPGEALKAVVIVDETDEHSG
jgi:L-iditol 2-dehydrogenase